MTPTFAVDEVAVMQNCKRPGNNGRECLIIEGPKRYKLLLQNNEIVFGYQVSCPNGDMYTCRPDQLRKKRPPEPDDAAARQAMLDCIERARQPVTADA